jgi:hypothetical protein
MRHKKLIFFSVILGCLVLAVSIFLMTATPVEAQCGSQTSSCKNCHETQAQDPVNNDGTAWHSQHAFGDFCYLCHGGNNQATDEATAHIGLVDPLSDIVTNCKSCHPNDYEADAQIYATTLGVQLGSGAAAATSVPASTPPANSATEATSNSPTTETTSNLPSVTTLAVDDPNLVNYAQRYDEIVLGKHPVNWGNVILVVMIFFFLVGGGGFILMHERMVKVSFGDTGRIEGEYPKDVLEMLSAIVKLKPQMRKSLRSIIDKPDEVEKIINLINVVEDNKPKE